MLNLSSKVINYILGVLLVIFLGVSGWLWLDNNSMEKEILGKNNSITTLTVQRDALQSSNETLKAAIDTQNKNVDKLGDIKLSIDKMFTDFGKSVAVVQKTTTDIKQSVQKEKTPETCKGAIQYLRDARKELK